MVNGLLKNRESPSRGPAGCKPGAEAPRVMQWGLPHTREGEEGVPTQQQPPQQLTTLSPPAPTKLATGRIFWGERGQRPWPLETGKLQLPPVPPVSVALLQIKADASTSSQ